MNFRTLRRKELNAALAVMIVVSCLALIFLVHSRPAINHFGYEHDFVNVVAGSHCIFDGCDPYDSASLEREFQRMGGYTPTAHFLPEWPVYPPSTLLLLMPLSLLRWPLLSLVWILLCFGFFSAACIVLILKFRAYRDLLAFLPFVILLTDKSIGWAVQLGQPAFIAAASTTLAIVLLVSRKAPRSATALLALSLCLKPQMAFLCGLYFLLQKETRKQAIIAYGFTAAAAIAGTFLFYFRLSSFSFLSHLAANLRLSLKPGRDSDPSILNPGSAGFLNLQAFVARFSHSSQVWNDVTYAVGFALAALLVFSFYRNRNFAVRPYAILAALVMIELLVTYHRTYDHLLLLAVLPAFYEIATVSMAEYLGLIGCLCIYRFSQLHGAWMHGRGPFPLGPPMEVVMALFFMATLWHGRPRALLHRDKAPRDGRKIASHVTLDLTLKSEID